MKNIKKKYIVIGVVAVVVVVLVIWLSSSIKTPKNIVVDIDVPLQVDQGEKFTIVVTVQNTADRAKELDSIDIGETYLEGIAVLSSDPAYAERYYVPGVKAQSYSFGLSIPAQDELVVRFTASALTVGDFEGALAVCIGGPANCLLDTMRTIVSSK